MTRRARSASRDLGWSPLWLRVQHRVALAGPDLAHGDPERGVDDDAELPRCTDFLAGLTVLPGAAAVLFRCIIGV